jgi:hypothetical protein
MTTHQKMHVFTRPGNKAVAACANFLTQTASSNGMIALTDAIDLRWVPTDDHRVLPAAFDTATNKRVPNQGNPFACSLMLEGACTKKFVGARIIEEGIDGKPEMGPNIKQVMHLRGVGADKLIALYRAWPNAAATCPGHQVRELYKKAKKKEPTEKQLLDFCTQLVDSGKVFFPIGEDGENDDGTPRYTFKPANKIVKNNLKYKRATGSGFDIDAVDEYFANNPNSGITLIKFVGRDGKEWKGKADEIGKIHYGFFGVDLFSDYFAPKINKFTMPTRAKVAVCIDVETTGNAGSNFVMADMQGLAGMQVEEDEGGVDDSSLCVAEAAASDKKRDRDDAVAVGAPDTDVDDVDAFVHERKRQKKDE